MVRKHIKVEPQRWFYWADRLGLLVWQDMPSMDLRTPDSAARTQWEAEYDRIIDQHRSSPSLVMWVNQNEAGASTTRPASPRRSRRTTPPAW